MPTSKSVAVIGAGNIGSQLLQLLARMPQIVRMIIVDPDFCRADNYAQHFAHDDVGQPKAVAAARRLQSILRSTPLRVEAIVGRVENVPWGRLRTDIICGSVDSRLARAAINHIACRLGIPYIDAGINSRGLLVRVETHIPGDSAPCLQCCWAGRDYELLAQSYSCTGKLLEPAPTRAPSALGALAASLQALECQKILGGMIDRSVAGKQIVIQAEFQQHFVNVLRRNPKCHCDHHVWDIHQAPQAVQTVADLATFGRGLFDDGDQPVAMSVEGNSWMTKERCDCGEQLRRICLQGRDARSCPRCDGPMQPLGFFLRPTIELKSASDRLLGRPLRQLGLGRGDVVTLSGTNGVRHIELNLADKAEQD